MSRPLIVAFFLVAIAMITNCNKHRDEIIPYGTELTATQGGFVSNPKTVDVQSTPLHTACGTDVGQIDSRLKPGMNFETTYKTINGTKAEKLLSTRARIISVDPKKLEERVMPVLTAGLSYGQVGNEEALTCSYDDQGKASCVLPIFLREISPSVNGEYKSCALSGDGSSNGSPSAVSGKFKLLGGAVVDAFQIATSFEGILLCDGQRLGKGERLDVLILSNDVPNEGAAGTCGGTTIFSSSVFKNRTGRVMFGSSYERTVIPTTPVESTSPVSSPSPSPIP